jgi:hypothetical protein
MSGSHNSEKAGEITEKALKKHAKNAKTRLMTKKWGI